MVTFVQVGANTVTLSAGEAGGIIELDATGIVLSSITIGGNLKTVSMVYKDNIWVVNRRS
jgi:hypothetical protein